MFHNHRTYTLRLRITKQPREQRKRHSFKYSCKLHTHFLYDSTILSQNKKEAMIQRQHEDVLQVLEQQVSYLDSKILHKISLVNLNVTVTHHPIHRVQFWVVILLEAFLPYHTHTLRETVTSLTFKKWQRSFKRLYVMMTLLTPLTFAQLFPGWRQWLHP